MNLNQKYTITNSTHDKVLVSAVLLFIIRLIFAVPSSATGKTGIGFVVSAFFMNPSIVRYHMLRPLLQSNNKKKLNYHNNIIRFFSSNPTERTTSTTTTIMAKSSSTNDNVSSIIDDPLLTIIPKEIYNKNNNGNNNINRIIELPNKLAYPHCYEPHPIAKYACNQVREQIKDLSNQKWTKHDFGVPNKNMSSSSIPIPTIPILTSATRKNTTKTTTTNSAQQVGKMFGVLVVRINNNNNNNNNNNKDDSSSLGYLKAFSGTITGVSNPETYGFCPSLYNRYNDVIEEGTTTDTVVFSYQKEEAELNKINKQVSELENNPKRKHLQDVLETVTELSRVKLAKAREIQKQEKKRRKEQREQMKKKISTTISTTATNNDQICQQKEYDKMEQELVQQSAYYQRHVREVKAECESQIKAAKDELENEFENKIQQLKQLRRDKSSSVQNRLFEQYQFLNIRGEKESLIPIFAKTPLVRPPSGAGDCAAPKLFQYAFQKGYQPVAMAEFWWGKSPLQEIRRHNLYYPACRGKCEPILSHMLQGLPVQDNPLDYIGVGSATVDQAERKEEELKILFEDDYIVVVDKPNEMLSVPGRQLNYSVYSVMKDRYPNSTGPLLVHRLDMSTSGILIVAKDKDTHQHIQAQFVNRTVKKRYTALLEGDLTANGAKKKGKIDLPLCMDYMNRPMQKVSFEEGKPAVTHYEILQQSFGTEGDFDDGNGEDTYGGQRTRTRIHFYPVTGRTHQLRVHAAHPQGLDTPIVGDDIYGQRDKRLCLHAGYLELVHPKTNKKMLFTSETPF